MFFERKLFGKIARNRTLYIPDKIKHARNQYRIYFYFNLPSLGNRKGLLVPNTTTDQVRDFKLYFTIRTSEKTKERLL